MKELDIRKVKEHYEIYTVEGKFVCSCDIGELNETLEEISA